MIYLIRRINLGTMATLSRMHLRDGLKLMATRHSSQTPKRATRNELMNLLKFAAPEKYRLGGALSLLFVSSGVTMALPYAIGKIIDLIYTSDDPGKCREKMTPFCKMLAVVFFIGGLANAGRVYLIKTSGQRVVKRLRDRAFSSMLVQETAFSDENRTGELINRLSADTTVIANSVTQNVSDGLRASVLALTSAGMMVYTSPTLALVGLTIVPIVGVMSVPFGRYMKKLSSGVQNNLAASTQVAEERISNIRTVRAFAKENYEISRYSRSVERVLNLTYAEARASAVFYGLTGFLGNSLVISVLYVGGMLISSGSITVGQLSSFMLYVVFSGTSVNGLSSFYTEIMKGLGASQRLFDIIERKPAIPLDHGIIPQDMPNCDIQLNHVTFSYPTRTDAKIFNDLQLEIPSGQITAIVGPSGSGKSTLAALLLRFYEVNKGVITLDGTPMNHFSPQWLRSNIGLVAQEPVLFSSSIRENIAYGGTDVESVPEQKIIDAAKQANAWQFIQRFPEGLDTLVGERGVLLSGGQKQRVAIARAILKNPHILILDEATSALDSESEYLVQQALQSLMLQRTVIVIAHRLSTIKHAHNIVVFDAGRVAEQGNYGQLIDARGKFHSLVERQTFSG